MGPYGGMKLAAAIRLLLRTGRCRRGRMNAVNGPRRPPPRATELLDWHPRVMRRVDERQGDLLDRQGREVEARPNDGVSGFTPWW
jgi:hypothetical protein